MESDSLGVEVEGKSTHEREHVEENESEGKESEGSVDEEPKRAESSPATIPQVE